NPPPSEPRAGGEGPIRETAQRADRAVLERYPRALMLVPCGQPIGERQLEILENEHYAFQESLGPGERWQRAVALFLIFSLLTTLIVLYVSRFQTALAQSLPMIYGVCVLALATLFSGLFL